VFSAAIIAAKVLARVNANKVFAANGASNCVSDISALLAAIVVTKTNSIL
jgi:hypothetical protein